MVTKATDGAWPQPGSLVPSVPLELYPRVSKASWGIWGFPKIRGPFLVVLIIRALLFWGPY